MKRRHRQEEQRPRSGRPTSWPGPLRCRRRNSTRRLRSWARATSRTPTPCISWLWPIRGRATTPRRGAVPEGGEPEHAAGAELRVRPGEGEEDESVRAGNARLSADDRATSAMDLAVRRSTVGRRYSSQWPASVHLRSGWQRIRVAGRDARLNPSAHARLSSLINSAGHIGYLPVHGYCGTSLALPPANRQNPEVTSFVCLRASGGDTLMQSTLHATEQWSWMLTQLWSWMWSGMSWILDLQQLVFGFVFSGSPGSRC